LAGLPKYQLLSDRKFSFLFVINYRSSEKEIYAYEPFHWQSCPFRKSCTYLLTIGNPYWSDKGRTPTALHTVTRYRPNWLESHNIGWRLENMSETICRKQNSIIEGPTQAIYHCSDHQPNPRTQKHFVGLFQILLQAAQEQHKGPLKIPRRVQYKNTVWFSTN